MPRRIARYLVLALSVVWVNSVSAQLVTATISGEVHDTTGAVLPGVTITVANVATGTSRTIVTDAAGEYRAPNLSLGPYEVRAELPGFGTAVTKGIELTVGRHAVINLTLTVGEFAEAIVVTAEVALVDTRDASVRALVDERKILDLPLNSRDLAQLTYLQPGVIRSQASPEFQSGMGAKISVAGSRVQQHVFLTDGTDGGDLSGNPQGVSGAYLGAETVKEFEIITNNYSAEYPNALGGVINAVTKSGTNQWRGSAFEFLRHSALDARTYFDEKFDLEKPEFRQDQYGFALGGPIRRDRMFVFGSYEGQRARHAVTSVGRVPTLAARQGILPNGVFPVAPGVRPYLDLWPAPNGTDHGDWTADYVGTSRNPVDTHLVNVKVDYELGSPRAGRLSGNYLLEDGKSKNLGLFPDTNAEMHVTKKQVVGIGHLSVLSQNTMHDFRFGYTRSQPSDRIAIPERDLSAFALVPDRPMGQLSVPNVAGLGYSRVDRQFWQTTVQFKNALSLIWGRHSMKMGADVRYLYWDVHPGARGCCADFDFDTFELFLAGRANRLDLHLPGSVQERNFRTWRVGSYFQDELRATDSLTFQMGLRHEFWSIPREVHGYESNLHDFFDPETTVGPIFGRNPSLKNFGPRVGFAWDPSGTGRTSLRGGFGVFYELLPLVAAFSNFQEIPPFAALGTMRSNANAIEFPVDPARYAPSLSQTPSARTLEYNPSGPTQAYRASLTLDRQLSSNWAVSVGYTWSRSLRNVMQSDGNTGSWVILSDGRKYYPSPNAPINPNFADIRLQEFKGSGYYHGGTLVLRRKFSGGMQYQASYTFSKAVDNSSGYSSGGDGLPSQRSIMAARDPHLEKGLSSFHVKHAFTSTFSYALPFATDSSGIAAALGKGWQVNAIVLVASGPPISILGSNRNAQRLHMISTDSLRPDLIEGGNPNPVLGGPDLYFDPGQFVPSALGFYGNLGRNTLIGPGVATVDVSTTKRFAVTQGRDLEFRVEIFNVLNRANFGQPNTTVFDTRGRPSPTAGRITRLSTTARQVQFGLKFLF